MKLPIPKLTAILSSVLLSTAATLAQNTPDRVRLDNFHEIKSYVVGSEYNQLYMSVPWVDNVLDGQAKAAKEDKPILLWLYFGGPLGNC